MRQREDDGGVWASSGSAGGAGADGAAAAGVARSTATKQAGDGNAVTGAGAACATAVIIHPKSVGSRARRSCMSHRPMP